MSRIETMIISVEVIENIGMMSEDWGVMRARLKYTLLTNVNTFSFMKMYFHEFFLHRTKYSQDINFSYFNAYAFSFMRTCIFTNHLFMSDLFTRGYIIRSRYIF